MVNVVNPKPDTTLKNMVGATAPSVSLGDMMAERKKALEPYKTEAETAAQKASEFETEKAQFELGQKEKVARTKLEAMKSATAKEEAAYKEADEANQEMLSAKFVPHQDNVQDLMGLFTLIGVVGFAIGSGGKNYAQQAMAAQNGMLEGYQKGRADLYKKEKDKFDENVKLLREKARIVSEKAKRVAEIAAKDPAMAEQEALILSAQEGAGFYKDNYQKFGYAKAAKDAEDAFKSADKIYAEIVKEHIKASRRTGRVQPMIGSDGNTYLFFPDGTVEKAELPSGVKLTKPTVEKTPKGASTKGASGAGGAGGKTLSDKQSKEIEGLDSLLKGLEQLKKDFKPEYASLGVLGFGADMEFEARRRLGNKKGQEAISWWSRYERLQAPNRHALFGATLTGNELKNYQSFTAKKSDSPDTVKTFLEDQINYSKSIGENKKLVYEAAGYKVPEAKARDFIQSFSGDETQNLEQEAIKRFGSYDPNKYDYGFENGKFYRDAK